MTKRELTGYRDLTFNLWIRNQLPDSSTGFAVSDIDFMIWNWRTKKMMMLEVKTKHGKLPPFQRRMFGNISRWIRDGIQSDWTYYGFNVLQFSDNSFNDGVAYINDVEVTEAECIHYLSLEWNSVPIDFERRKVLANV